MDPNIIYPTRYISSSALSYNVIKKQVHTIIGLNRLPNFSDIDFITDINISTSVMYFHTRYLYTRTYILGHVERTVKNRPFRYWMKFHAKKNAEKENKPENNL